MRIQSIDEKIRKNWMDIIIKDTINKSLLDIPDYSYRQMWEEMIGRIIDVLSPGASISWKSLDPGSQDEIANQCGIPYNDFLGKIAKIVMESSINEISQ